MRVCTVGNLVDISLHEKCKHGQGILFVDTAIRVTTTVIVYSIFTENFIDLESKSMKFSVNFRHADIRTVY